MPRSNVKLIPGYYFHIYNRAVSDDLLFVEDKNYYFFLLKIKKYLLTDSDVLAYCLMPNHYHLILKIKSDQFSSSMHKFALSYVVAFNKMYHRKGRLYISPFQRIHIQNPSYLLHLSKYIHKNPLKAKLVTRVGDWKYSSYCEYIGKREIDFINPGFILDILSDDINSSIVDQQKDYREFVEDRDEVLQKNFVP